MHKAMISFSIVVLGFGAIAATGCGDDGSREIEEEECEHHTDCSDGEACFGGECMDAPQEGDPCLPGHEGEEYEDLRCEEETWQTEEIEDPSQQEDPEPEMGGLEVVAEPSGEVVAGENFEVEVMLVDEEEEQMEREGVDISLTLNQGEFADGTDVASADTSPQGIAGFELVIEETGTGYELEATSGYEDLEEASATTAPFDVIAAAPVSDLAWIYGEDGIAANGVDEAEITIELFDEYENPVVGVVPAFEASGEGNEYGDCTETDAGGTATCTMTSTEAGDKTLEIVDPVNVTGETIAFVLECLEEGEPFGGGDGSDDDPHLICSPKHLDTIGNDEQYLEDSFVVARNIDLDDVENFEPIGDDNAPFAGSFDGQEFIIENLTVDRPSEIYVGLFGNVEAEAVVEDVRLENVEIHGGWATGGLIGANHGAVRDVTVTGQVSGFDSDAGGVVGWNAPDGVLTNVGADVEVYGEASGTGGLVGSNRGEIVDSYATGVVTGDSREVGGLVGGVSSSGMIVGSYATGDVYLENESDEGGGLAGLMEGDISDCYATGDVYGTERIGGLVGYHYDGALIGSYATGDVHGTVFVGGLVGYRNDGAVFDSYSMGHVDGEESVGGLVGYHRQGLIDASYTTGQVEGDVAVGTFVGTNEEGEFSASYWDTDLIDVDDAVGDGDDDGLTGLETSDFDDASEFSGAGWDFEDIWTIGQAPDGVQRPVLLWQVD